MNYFVLIFWILSLLALNNFIKAAEQTENFKKTSPTKQSMCKSQYNGAILANPDDCQKFFICVNQQAHEYNCDPSFHFDKTTHSCVPGSSCNADANKPTVSCSEGDVRTVQDDCYIFEACIHGQYQKINCPVNYYFYAPNSMCVPFKYDAQFKCSCLMPTHTVLENKNNCETYYVCKDKSAILKNCPLGQYYNPQLNTCITDVTGVCLMKPTITPNIEKELSKLNKNDMNVAEATCALLGKEGVQFQTFAKGCNTFYICINGQLYEQHCPQDFYYDTDKKYCVIDTENKCKTNDDESVKVNAA